MGGVCLNGLRGDVLSLCCLGPLSTPSKRTEGHACVMYSPKQAQSTPYPTPYPTPRAAGLGRGHHEAGGAGDAVAQRHRGTVPAGVGQHGGREVGWMDGWMRLLWQGGKILPEWGDMEVRAVAVVGG